MPATFSVRVAALADAEQICGLAAELGYPSPLQQVRASLEALLCAQSELVMVAARADGSLLGWMAVSSRVTLESGRKAVITGLVVTTSARRSGVGRALVAAAEAWAAAHRHPALAVRSDVTRAGAHDFYRDLGYGRTTTQHCYEKLLPTG
jgi:GNAT superfamily N-acetyltransferase